MLPNTSTARKRLAMVGTLVASLLAFYGCASQNWVIDTIREVDKDLVARVARIETAAAEEKTRLDGVDGRLTRVLANRLKRTEVQEVEVTFETGKSDLSQAARGTLEGILKVLSDNPTYTADVVGHTDTVGKADYNVNLSWLREEAVRRFLVERGAGLNRLSFIGVGEELAGDDTKDAAKRAKNRKVTVKVFRPAD